MTQVHDVPNPGARPACYTAWWGGRMKVGITALAALMLGSCGGGRGGASSIEQCGDLMVRGNVYTPYGVEVVDCAVAEVVAQEVVTAQWEVRLDANNCVLEGTGQDAKFVCVEFDQPNYGGRGVPGVVGEEGIPIRDERGRIPGIVMVRGALNYQVMLVQRGAARPDFRCADRAAPGDFCALLARDMPDGTWLMRVRLGLPGESAPP